LKPKRDDLKIVGMVQTQVTTPSPNSVGNALRGIPADPERHGVRSLQENRRIVTRNVGELNHAKLSTVQSRRRLFRSGSLVASVASDRVAAGGHFASQEKTQIFAETAVITAVPFRNVRPASAATLLAHLPGPILFGMPYCQNSLELA
jgi:hypothetical protein